MEVGNAQDWGPIKLMYKKQGEDEHKSIVDIFDEIFIKLNDIERRITQLEQN